MKTYFQDLLTTAAAEHNSLYNTHSNQPSTGEELEEGPPSILDIEIAIQYMRNNKLPGVGNIAAELYKNGGQLLINKVHTRGC